MKGIELPTYAMVAITLTIIVLLSLLIIFFNIWSSGSKSISTNIAKSVGYRNMVSVECRDTLGDPIDPRKIEVKYDANQDGKIDLNDNLYDLFVNVYGITNEAQMRKECGCPI